MAIEDEDDVSPAIGRMLFTVFEALEDWCRREQAASREVPTFAPAVEKYFSPPPPLPLVSNVVVRKEPNAEVTAWLDLRDHKYTLRRDYLMDGDSLDSLRVRLSLLDHSERLLFVATIPGEVEAFAPGRWVEDFLRLFEAIVEQAREEGATMMLKICRLGYWTGEGSE